MINRIRVLIVDDSAFARKVIREVLTRDPEIDVVGIARDGLEALEKIPELRPDVVTLDLLMPDLDGLGVLRALKPENSPRVIIVSASATDSDLALEALQEGAVDLIMKPTPLPTDRLYDLASDLIAKVKAAATARAFAAPTSASTAPLARKVTVSTDQTPTANLIVIGTSTGGPQALTALFKSLPKDLPVPVAIALHIPAGYTAPLAARLTKLGSIPVDEAHDGMELLPGRAVIAPGGMHLRIQKTDSKFFASVSREPEDSIYHPSVDLLFKSAAETAGRGLIAVVMTGMGSDGFNGSVCVREKGGRVMAESAASCIVFGMPRCVIEGGTANLEAPLEQLADRLVEQVFS